MTDVITSTSSNTERGGVLVLGFGPQRIDFLKMASDICGEDAVLDQDLARMAGANFAVGFRPDLATLRSRLEAFTISETVQKHRNSNLGKAAIEWLACGHRGLSSNTLFTFLTGVSAEKENDGHNYPHDPDDLSRCRRLLETCPDLVSCLPRVAAAGPEWRVLIQRWDEVCGLMDQEAPRWREGQGDCPRTYALMRSIFETARREQP